MTNWGYDDSTDDSQGEVNENNGPKALRDAYKALKAQNDELNQKLTSFLEDQKKSQMAAVFESLGVPGAAQVYQGDADPEKAKAWVESMRGVFGTGNNAGGQTPPPATPPAMTPEQQQQYQLMNEAGQDGVPMGNINAASAALGSATSMDDIANIFKNLGGAH